MTIEQKRRELFEAWWVNVQLRKQPEKFNNGDYFAPSVYNAWVAFNAALDAVVIDLPPLNNSHIGGPDSEMGPSIEQVEDAGYDYAVKDCRAAIESTGLGLKVLP